MSNLRLAAQQALEALETCDAAHPSDGGQQWYDDKLVESAITTLRAALAEPVQEPVAWLAPDGSVRKTTGAKSFSEWKWGPNDFKPLYAAPPQRKPLTEEEIEDFYFNNFSIGELKAFARAIERAHGIGGQDELQR